MIKPTYHNLRSLVSNKLLHGRLGPSYYRVRTLLHRPENSLRRKVDKDISNGLIKDAVCVTSLEDLALAETTELMHTVSDMLPGLPNASEHKPKGNAADGRSTSLHCYSVDPPELIVQYPIVLKWGLEEHLLDIMEAYLGLPPALTNVHVRKDFGNRDQVGTRIWHVDTEDYRVVRLIVYLSDVTIDDGPFEYIPKRFNSICSPLLKRALRAEGDPVLDIEMRDYVAQSDWQQCTGPSGTVVIADNAALFHHGKPHNSERIILIYTYTSRKPRYPKLTRNAALDDRLTPRQQSCFFVNTQPR